MSGILRNTLRIIGTAKYAPNYLKTNKCINNILALHQPNFNNLAPKLQFNEASNFGTAIQAVEEKISSSFSFWENSIGVSIRRLEVSVYSGKISLYTLGETEKLTFTPTLSIQHSGHLIEPHRNEIINGEKTFQMGKWNVTLDDDKLIFNINDTGETFILKHTIHMKAHRSPPILLANYGRPMRYSSEAHRSPPTDYYGRHRRFTSKTISDVSIYPNELISKVKRLRPLRRSFPPIKSDIVDEQLEFYGDNEPGCLSDCQLTNEPNEFGRMKLKFPMTASLEGAQQKIKINANGDDYLIVYHRVDIHTFKKKKLPKYLENEIAYEKKDKSSTAGILHMELESGKIFFEPESSSDQCVNIRYKVDIEIDLESDVPSIFLSPFIYTQSRLE